jgi:hypothetical protein
MSSSSSSSSSESKADVSYHISNVAFRNMVGNVFNTGSMAVHDVTNNVTMTLPPPEKHAISRGRVMKNPVLAAYFSKTKGTFIQLCFLYILL